VLGLQTAEVQFYCDERPAAQADKCAKLCPRTVRV
jgi:hypothetical protein